jgi:hypothetical protein
MAHIYCCCLAESMNPIRASYFPLCKDKSHIINTIQQYRKLYLKPIKAMGKFLHVLMRKIFEVQHTTRFTDWYY